MKTFTVTVAVASLVSTVALATLVLADRQLGVPVPYAASLVVAVLNMAAGLCIASPRRIVAAQTAIAKPLGLVRRVAKPGLATVRAMPIDEAIVWLDASAVAIPREQAA